jgi:type I restriction enzyme S subunit
MNNNDFIKLNQLCSKITDGSHYSPKGIDSGIPMLSVKDMEDNRFSYADCKYISNEDYLDLIKSDCKPLLNDVLIAKDGSYLKHVFVIRNETEQAVLSSIGILRPNLKKIVPEYLKYYLQTKSVKETVAKKYVSGSALPRIILKNFGEIDVIYKDITTQHKIASVLSALDSKIELNNRINAELETMAKTLYDYWFVQFDFPDENGKPYKTSGGMMVWNEELKREIPEGWEVEILENVVDKIIDNRGKTPLKLGGDWSNDKNGVIALSAKHVKNGKLLKLQDANVVTHEMFEKWMPNKLQEGDILMTSEAPCGEFYLILNDTNYCLSQRLFAIRANKNKVLPNYLYFEL